MKTIITIDGGVATGTSTLARNLALALDLPRIDSGSLYRGVTFAVLAAGDDPLDAAACEVVAKKVNLDMPDGEVLAVDGAVVVEWLDGQRIDRLHTASVDQVVPIVAAHKGVRNIIDQRQRAYVEANGGVADGRATGTKVFPSAQLKLYLTCQDQEAARRRSEADGRLVTQDEVRQRNQADQSRRFGPLAQAADAVAIDTTYLEVGEMVQLALELIVTPPADRPQAIWRDSANGTLCRRVVAPAVNR